MSKIQNLEFAALNVSGDNYLQWALDIKIILRSRGLGECIEEENNASVRDKYKAILLIRHHLNESLKNQYLTIEDPLDLWTELKNRYDHQRTVLLPQAQFDWKNLRIQDFKSVDEYNSALFKIVSILRLCGEEMDENALLEKTFSTFHTNNMLLQQQYRERGFKKYADLISCLLLAEKNNELLMMNSAMRPPGSAPIPEAQKVEMAKKEPKETKESNYIQKGKFQGRGRGKGKWNKHGNGRGNYHSHGQGNHYGGRGRGNYGNYGRGKGRGGISKPPHSNKSVCHRCGMDNHWAKTCRTSEYFVDLYQKTLKKSPEANLVQQDGEDDFDHENDDLMEFETSDCLKD